ncbi:ATP-dependent zinc protease [Candidatus Saccharibacteria bacterium CG_4_10_14_0_2_um_filter_52_9]|nr:MAG: ATP-dependent zinc protease [Candidatus Saccharibacteria bacterium CG_4_10_14_0_2_um_filter_52_9]
MKFTWSSFKKAAVPRTIGPLLELDLPLLSIESLTAKVDTGAFSGALHATRIREVVDTEGKKHLRFSPLGSKEHTLEVDSYHKRRVKSSNGVVVARYAVDTDVRIFGQTFPITITLTNRAAMKRPMLIGRNFLRLHGFLVDVNQNNK